MRDERFSDINYAPVESRQHTLNNLLREFKTLDSSIDQRLKNGEYKAVKLELDNLRKTIAKHDSELGRECLELLKKIENHCLIESKNRRKRNIGNIFFLFLFLSPLIALIILVYVHLSIH